MKTGGISHWFAQTGLPPRRAPLAGDTTADVAIIGAGYTGLWTAWHLSALRPDLRILLVEQHFAGYGASGRNGGWLTGGFPWNHQDYARTHGEAATRAFVAAMLGTVDAIIAVAEAQGIDADIQRTDELMVALNAAQLARLRAEAEHRAQWGEAGRIGMIDAAALARRIAIPGALGALVVNGVARIQPAKLVTGLARAVEARGAIIAEGTQVTAIAPGRLSTTRGTVTAPLILRCTEGFTAALPGHRRTWLPLNSAQIVTDPLPAAVWERIGWQGAEILGDGNHVYCYCQRTADGRIAIGSRGTPYRFGSRIDTDGVPDAGTIADLMAILHRHFPAARDIPIAHAWCGTLGVPRDWCATVGLGADGIGWAGGYVGVGVSTSYLAGQTLAELALGLDTPRTALPWTNRIPRPWEPEPLRWLGVRGLYAAYAAADRAEARAASRAGASGPTLTSRLVALANRLTGRG